MPESLMSNKMSKYEFIKKLQINIRHSRLFVKGLVYKKILVRLTVAGKKQQLS